MCVCVCVCVAAHPSRNRERLTVCNCALVLGVARRYILFLGQDAHGDYVPCR